MSVQSATNVTFPTPATIHSEPTGAAPTIANARAGLPFSQRPQCKAYRPHTHVTVTAFSPTTPPPHRPPTTSPLPPTHHETPPPRPRRTRGAPSTRPRSTARVALHCSAWAAPTLGGMPRGRVPNTGQTSMSQVVVLTWPGWTRQAPGATATTGTNRRQRAGWPRSTSMIARRPRTRRLRRPSLEMLPSPTAHAAAAG